MSVIGQSNVTLHTQKRTFAATLNEQWLIEEQTRIHGKVLVRSLKFEVWGITVIASILINEVVWYIFAKTERKGARPSSSPLNMHQRSVGWCRVFDELQFYCNLFSKSTKQFQYYKQFVWFIFVMQTGTAIWTKRV